MADLSHSPAAGLSLLQILTAPFRTLGHALSSLDRMWAQSRQLERLMNMTDDQLAARGLTRDGLVHHVFADYLAN